MTPQHPHKIPTNPPHVPTLMDGADYFSFISNLAQTYLNSSLGLIA